MRLAPLVVAALVFALYVTCPRMTAMIATQAKLTRINPALVIALGCILSIPLFLALLYALNHWGAAAAVLLAAVFDAAAALLLGELDLKAGLELAIITLFVYAGIRAAPKIVDALLYLAQH